MRLGLRCCERVLRGSSLETDQHSHVREEFSLPSSGCDKVKFQTNGCSSASSGGPFTVDGYGTLPKSCHNTNHASCEIDVCGQNKLVVRAGTSDRWVYEVDVNGHRATPKYTCGKDYGVASECCGGSSLETDQHSHVEEEFPIGRSTGCHNVKLVTNGCSSASSGGPFTVDGYGEIPKSCHNSNHASCTIQVCNQSQLQIHAQTSDRWVFYVEVDGKRASPQHTCGVHYGKASECCGGSSLETDQHTHVLEKFSWP